MRLHLIAQLGYANDASPPIEGWFDVTGGTVGRDQRCHMVLVDPLRRISRIQAQILWENNAFHLLNASTSNPVYVNGKELSPGERSTISAQEEWRTGNYVIAVRQVLDAPDATAAVPDTSQMPAQAPAGIDIPVQPPTPLQPVTPIQEPAPAQQPAWDASPPQEQASPASLMRGPFDDLLGSPVEQPTAESATRSASATPLAGFPDDPFASPAVPVQPSRPSPAIHSQSDPFADLMGAPLDAQLSSAPVAPFAQSRSNVIPDDFNPMASGGVSHRNLDDPLTQLAQSGNVKDMFPERSLDAIFQPADGSIDSMTLDPLQDARHQSFMDASSKLDPLDIFSSTGAKGELNTDALFGDHDRQGQVQRDHTSELGSYFRAPRALHDAQFSDPATAAPEPSRIPSAESSDDPLASILQDSIGHGVSASTAFPIEAEPLPAPDLRNDPIAHPAVPLPQDPSGKVESLDAFFDLAPPSDNSVSVLGVELPPAASHGALPSGLAEQVAAHTGEAHVLPTIVDPSAHIGVQEGMDRPAHHAPTTETAPSETGAADAIHAQQLLDAFKQGAGLSDCRYPHQLTPEVMHTIGQMLAGSVQGFMDLLGSRAATKQEVRIAVTLINAEANNPLKFLPTGAAALAQIFGPRMPGFLPGPAAIENARLDLRSHEVGMMAGTQASVQGLFERFDPQIIEQQLDAQGRQRTLFATQRHARLWDMYCSHYRWLKDEMKNQSPASWGGEFHSAYQTETDSMDNKGTGK